MKGNNRALICLETFLWLPLPAVWVPNMVYKVFQTWPSFLFFTYTTCQLTCIFTILWICTRTFLVPCLFLECTSLSTLCLAHFLLSSKIQLRHHLLQEMFPDSLPHHLLGEGTAHLASRGSYPLSSIITFSIQQCLSLSKSEFTFDLKLIFGIRLHHFCPDRKITMPKNKNLYTAISKEPNKTHPNCFVFTQIEVIWIFGHHDGPSQDYCPPLRPRPGERWLWQTLPLPATARSSRGGEFPGSVTETPSRQK